MNQKGITTKIDRSKGMLKEALISLLYDMKYSDIAISDITERACLARCTFYRHYKTKEDLLLECCKDRFDGLFQRMSQENINTFHGAGLGYFDYWNNQREFLEVLNKNDLLYFFMQNHDKLMYDVSMRLKPENIRNDLSEYSVKSTYHFFCSMSAMLGILMHWLKSGSKESPEALAQYYVSFIAEGFEVDEDCIFYQKHHRFPYNPCFIKPGI